MLMKKKKGIVLEGLDLYHDVVWRCELAGLV